MIDTRSGKIGLKKKWWAVLVLFMLQYLIHNVVFFNLWLDILETHAVHTVANITHLMLNEGMHTTINVFGSSAKTKPFGIGRAYNE